MNELQGKDVGIDYARLFVRACSNHWKMILLTAVVVWVGVGLVVLFFIPTTYEASATIFIDDWRSRAPTFLRDLLGTKDTDLHLAILRSRTLASDVVENLPPDALNELLNRPLQQYLLEDAGNALLRLLGRQAVAEDLSQRAVTELQRSRVQFFSKRGGEVEIRATAYLARTAVDLVNTYVEVLQSRTRLYAREEAAATREFLEAYLSQVRGTLQDAEQKLAKLTQGRGVDRPAEHVTAQQAQLAALEGQLADVQTSKEIAKARLRFLKGDKSPAGLSGPTPSQIVLDQLRQRLSTLNEKLTQLREKYTDEHPLVIATLGEIKDAQARADRILQSSQQPRPTGTVRLGAAERAAFAKQMADLEIEIPSLDAKEGVLKQRLAVLGRTASTLGPADSEASRLARVVETQRSVINGLSDKLAVVRIQEEAEGRRLRVIDPASLPQSPSNGATLRWLLFGLLGGLSVGIGLATFVEYFNQPIETEDEVVQLLGLPILGWLPSENESEPRCTSRPEPVNFFTAVAPQSLAAEGCRTIRTTLESVNRVRPIRTIMVASAGPREGKSTVLLNLALALREVGRRVIIVDADLRRPSLHRALRSHSEAGVVDTLSRNLASTEAVRTVDEGLLFLPAGTMAPRQQGSMLNSEQSERLLVMAKAHADFVLLDSAPILAVADNLVLASLVDGVVLVVRAGRTQRQDLLAAKEQLDKMGAHLLGVVMNRVSISRRQRYYARYGSYYSPDATPHSRRGWNLGRLWMSRGAQRTTQR